MAIQLQHSVFVHIPKTGGRWVANQLMKNVEGSKYIGDPVYDAHVPPETDLPVFAFIRHPITMLNSLWHHRSRKQYNKRAKDWNWQQDHELERECGCKDLATFFSNVADRPGIVTRYYMDFVGMYDNHTLWRTEDIAYELVVCLDLYNEKHDASAILEAGRQKIGAANNELIIDEDVAAKIIKNERTFCEQYNYTIHNYRGEQT